MRDVCDFESCLNLKDCKSNCFHPRMGKMYRDLKSVDMCLKFLSSSTENASGGSFPCIDFGQIL